MDLAYSLRRARRMQANFTAPSSPMSPTLTSYQSPFRDPSSPSTTNSSHSGYHTTHEFKLIGDESGQLRPLKLPPRLSPCSTPPRPQGSGRTNAPTWSGLLGFGSSKNKDFDPFAAAIERIRKDREAPPRDGQRAESFELASRSLTQCAYTPDQEERGGGKAHHKGAKAGLFTFVGHNSNKKRVFEVDERIAAGWMQNGNYSSDSRMEIVKENRSVTSAVYKQRFLACFGFKK